MLPYTFSCGEPGKTLRKAMSHFKRLEIFTLALCFVVDKSAGANWYKYKGYEYIVQQSPMANFSEAQSACVAGYNATLAMPITSESRLIQYLSNISESSWIGVIERNHTLTWADGTTLQPYEKNVFETNTINLNSTAICVTAGAGEKWKYANCNLRKGFVCQRNRTDIIKGQLLLFSGAMDNNSHEIIVPFDICQTKKPRRIYHSFDKSQHRFYYKVQVPYTSTWGFRVKVQRNKSSKENVLFSWFAEFETPTTKSVFATFVSATETSAMTNSTTEVTTIATKASSCTGRKIFDPTSGKTFTFHITPIGQTAISHELCTNGRPQASVDCLFDLTNVVPSSAHFGQPFTIPCNLTVDQATAKATAPDATPASVAQAVTSLKLITSGIKNAYSEVADNVIITLFQISNITSEPIAVQTLFDAMITTQHLMLEFPNNLNQNPKQALMLRKSLQNFADRVALPNEIGSLLISSGNIAIQANRITKMPENTFESITFPSQSYNQQLIPGAGQLAVTVPDNLLAKAWQQKKEESVKISFIYYDDYSLFPAQQNPADVVSVSIKGFQGTVTPPIEIVFNGVNETQGEVKLTNGTLKSVVTRTQCSVYQNASQRWIPNGCYLVEGSSPPKCSCYILASFSMIVSTKVLPSNFEMAIVSYIGLSLSVLALLLTICIYVGVRELLKRQPTVFLINICLNLMIVDLVFLLGVNQTQNRDVCYVITALLHYFLLTLWFWMTANAYNMYKAFTKVAYIGGSSIVKPVFICFAAPFVITLINCGVAISQDFKKYYPGNIFFESVYRARNMCWLHMSSLHFGFLLPVGALALLNVGFFVLIMWKITCMKSSITSTAESRNKADDLVIAFTLLMMMGLTWVFGYFMLVSDSIAYLTTMSWLFTIFNAFQGLLIFVLKCLRLEKIRKMWLYPFIDFITCRKKKEILDTELSSHRKTRRTSVNK